MRVCHIAGSLVLAAAPAVLLAAGPRDEPIQIVFPFAAGQ
jgi:hypothetical protein